MQSDAHTRQGAGQERSGRTVGQERFGHWQEMVRQGFAPMAMTTDRPDRFHAEQRVVPLGSLQVWEADCSRSQTARTPAMIRQSDPETLSVLITLKRAPTSRPRRPAATSSRSRPSSSSCTTSPTRT